jgi:hypothetical protein
VVAESGAVSVSEATPRGRTADCVARVFSAAGPFMPGSGVGAARRDGLILFAPAAR